MNRRLFIPVGWRWLLTGTEKLCFVQLLHPGGEPTAALGRRWNRGRHVRKFLRAGGQYVHNDDLVDGVVDFWGEWESESELVGEFRRPLVHGPKRVWRPYWVEKEDYWGLQNTDPFVFGGFYYTGCLQRRENGPTQLRYLARGSVVLFGSRVAGSFVVDTVFVVDDWIDHDGSSYEALLRGKVPDAYWDVTLKPRYANESGKKAWFCSPGEGLSWRLYFGASYDSPVEGMFSFVPCKPSAEAPGGFPRPSIELPGIVNPDFGRNFRLNPQSGVGNVVGLWERVAEQVQYQGLSLGVCLDLPVARVDG